MNEPPPAERLAAELAASGGGSVRAVLLYGSQLLRTRPDDHSAFDFVVIVEDYGRVYRALKAAGHLPRPVWLMTLMARVLPPNVIAFVPDQDPDRIGKCQILSKAHLERALGPRPPDHFVLARLLQRVATVWAAGPEEGEWVDEQLAAARGRVLSWLAPYLDGSFDAEGLGRRMLEVCYRGELRPESRERSRAVFEAQAEHFRAAYSDVLERGVADGTLRSSGSGYRLTRAASRREVRRWRRHFRRSKARATLRWFKHMVTFANWLPYIVRKVERHTGRTIELTVLERRLPIIFLWPRAVRVLISRPPRERGS